MNRPGLLNNIANTIIMNIAASEKEIAFMNVANGWSGCNPANIINPTSTIAFPTATTAPILTLLKNHSVAEPSGVDSRRIG